MMWWLLNVHWMLTFWLYFMKLMYIWLINRPHLYIGKTIKTRMNSDVAVIPELEFDSKRKNILILRNLIFEKCDGTVVGMLYIKIRYISCTRSNIGRCGLIRPVPFQFAIIHWLLIPFPLANTYLGIYLHNTWHLIGVYN